MRTEARVPDGASLSAGASGNSAPACLGRVSGNDLTDGTENLRRNPALPSGLHFSAKALVRQVRKDGHIVSV